MWPFTKKTEKFLKTGICVCTHHRNCHNEGRYRCASAVMQDGKILGSCACQIYIPGPGGNTEPPTIPTPTPSELEELYKR